MIVRNLLVVAEQEARFKFLVTVWAPDVNYIRPTFFTVCENVAVFVLVPANSANPVDVHRINEFSAKGAGRLGRHSGSPQTIENLSNLLQ